MMRFDRVLVVGANKIACDCMALLVKKTGEERLAVLETASSSVSMLCRAAGKGHIAYRNLTGAAEITDHLAGFVRGRRVLIVSANNRYIFREGLIRSPGVEIINFHYALLPGYRGMNIPSWVIFNGETETGITWHFVTEEIDHGDILAQRRIPIGEDTTAFDITREGMRLAAEAFGSFYEELLDRPPARETVAYPENGKVYKARELPGGGYLDPKRPLPEIGRLLRAYDYHGMGLMPRLKLVRDGNVYEVERYAVRTFPGRAGRTEEYVGDSVILRGDGMEITIRIARVGVQG